MSHAADLTLGRFEPLLRQVFACAGRGRSARVELIGVTPLPRHVPVTGEKFSLLFRGGTDTPLEQGLHTLSSDGTAAVELFLVPVITGERDVRHYEAVINRETPA